MRNVICCWVKGGCPQLENNIPLLFMGKRNLKLGYSNDFDVLIMDGAELLDDKYKRELINVGYKLHDVGKIYAELASKYKILDRFNEYEKKCFLRWPLIMRYLPGDKIIHYDGDVVFNEDPGRLKQMFNGHTFVLQGGPALTFINNIDWLTQYCEQLSLFSDDIEAYSQNAWLQRAGWEGSEQRKWAGFRDREIISSDQDLISHLIHTDRIIQDNPAEILKGFDGYILFENPLFLNSCYEYEKFMPFTYERKNNVDYLNGMRVVIWHMQCDFNYYLIKAIRYNKLIKHLLPRLAEIRISRDLQEKAIDHYFIRFYEKIFMKVNWDRLSVYNYYFGSNDFSEILNSAKWWKEGVFT